MSNLPVFNFTEIESMLVADSGFNNEGNKRLVPLLLPTVGKLPAILEAHELWKQPATVSNIAIARRRFIKQCQDDGMHYLAAEGFDAIIRILLENWHIHDQLLQKLIKEPGAFKSALFITDEEIMEDYLQIDPEVIAAITDQTTIADLVRMQPSAVCFNPGI